VRVGGDPGAAALGGSDGGHKPAKLAAAVFELGQLALVLPVVDLHLAKLDLDEIEQCFNRVLGNRHDGISEYWLMTGNIFGSTCLILMNARNILSDLTERISLTDCQSAASYN
jgi:hypothetical protein